MRRARAGVALILVAGVLGILAVLAAAFVTMAQLERRASSQRLYATKAGLLARSGIEDALARLSAGQDPCADANRYGGEDWDWESDPNHTLSSREALSEVYKPTGAGTAADVDGCPIRQAMRPSFPAKTSGNPTLLPVAGRERGYTGRLSGDQVPTGNSYALKVEDESAKINVNGGVLAAPSDLTRGWNGQLARVLGVLGQQGEVGIPTLGTAVLQNRPLGGYASLAQLQQRLGTTKDLSPYLTTSSWTDSKVVRPNEYPTSDGATKAALSELKKGRSQLSLEEGGRPPVNLNAAPRAVLVALLEGLRGRSCHTAENDPDYTDVSIDATLARDIADAIVARRRTDRFDTWSEFQAFCDSLVDAGVIRGLNTTKYGGGNLSGADVLKANFNPNTDLNKQLADQILWKWIDKSDLVVWSTEGSLGPTGAFRVEAAGRLLDAQGRLLAEATLGGPVEVFALLRQTTQRDFLAGRAPNGSDTSCLSLADPAPAPPFPFLRTAGAGAGASWWEGGVSPGRGLAVITYPNPPTAAHAGNPCEVDGCVGLATVEMEPVGGNALKFLHHFDDSWDADRGNPVGRVAGSSDAKLQTNLSFGIWPAPSQEPNTLYPDGMHQQYDRSPGFQAQGNLPPFAAQGNRGVFSFWVKGPTIITHMNTRFAVTCQRRPQNDNSQMILVGKGGGGVLIDGGDAWAILAENRANTMGLDDDVNHERIERIRSGSPTLTLLPGLRWQLVTVRFDTNEPVIGDDLGVAVRDIRGEATLADPSVGYNDPSWEMYIPADAQDIVVGGRLILGTTTPLYNCNEMADQVLDEFAIYDLGDVAATARSLAETLQDTRYTDGRYYKGDDAAFLSAVLEPEPGGAVRLLNVRWTAYLPSENRQEYLIAWGDNVPSLGQPRLLDADLANARVELDLLDETGTLTGAALQSLAQGATLGRGLQRFRYRARFINDLPDPQNDPVLETPFLDDVTFAWQPAGGPRFRGWERP